MIRRAIVEVDDGIYTVNCELKVDGVWQFSNKVTNDRQAALMFAERWLVGTVETNANET